MGRLCWPVWLCNCCVRPIGVVRKSWLGEMRRLKHASPTDRNELRHSRGGVLSRFSKLRQITAFLALLAISFQTFVVDTHVHPQALRDVNGFVTAVQLEHGLSAKAAGTASSQKQASTSPFATHSSICPLCQQFASEGNFSTARITSLSPPIAFVLFVFGDKQDTQPASFAAYIWRSRAPPTFA